MVSVLFCVVILGGHGKCHGHHAKHSGGCVSVASTVVSGNLPPCSCGESCRCSPVCKCGQSAAVTKPLIAVKLPAIEVRINRPTGCPNGQCSRR